MMNDRTVTQVKQRAAQETIKRAKNYQQSNPNQNKEGASFSHANRKVG